MHVNDFIAYSGDVVYSIFKNASFQYGSESESGDMVFIDILVHCYSLRRAYKGYLLNIKKVRQVIAVYIFTSKFS